MVDLNLEDFLYQLGQLGVKLGLKSTSNGEQLSVTGNLKALDNECKIKLKANKAAIINFIRSQQNQQQNQVPAIVAVDRSGPMAMSFAQQRLWLVEQITPGTEQFNMPLALRFKGELNRKALQQALDTIIERHEVLRTVYLPGNNNQGVQQVLPVTGLALEYTQLAPGQSLAELVQAHASISFDFEKDLMLKARLIKEAENSHVLLLTLHHIASDGWSMGVLSGELSELYLAYANGKANPLPPLALQYGDYAIWQRNWLKGEVLDAQLSYWQQQLSGLPERHALPMDRSYPAIASYKGADHHQLLAKPLLDGLNQLARRIDGTLFMVLNAALAALIYRYSGQTDVVNGTAVANREQPGLAPMVGFFINTLVIRNQVDGSSDFITLLEQCKKTLLNAYEHQQVPFEQLVDKLKTSRDLDHHPLFQIMLSLQNNQQAGLAMQGVDIEVVASQTQSAKYDLTLNANETDEGLALRWNFASDIFDAPTIAAMAERFEHLVAGIVENSENTAIDDLPLWPQIEQQQVIDQWSRGPEQTLDYRNSLMQMVSEHATPNQHRAESVALVDENQQFTFAQLEQKIAKLAASLAAQGVGQGDIVAICCTPSCDMVIAMFAIWRLNAAYLPLDIDSPVGRLDYILQDSQPTLALVDEHGASLLADVACAKLTFEQGYFEQGSQADLAPKALDASLVSQYSAEQLAYIMYTSGSTGKPKPVMLQHKCLINFMAVFHQQLIDMELPECEAWLLTTSMAFDPSVKAQLSLARGMKLVVASAVAAKSPQHILDLVAKHNLPIVNGTPTLMRGVFKHEAVHQLKPSMIFGGEAIDDNLWQQIYDYCHRHGRHALNVYGPTETTINSTYACIERYPSPTIGRPVTNNQTYVLDGSGKPVAAGVIGELYIGGEGLALGYRERESLTAERFTTIDTLEQAGRLYRTGDWVKWDRDGNLLFVGRRDDQLKRNGYRIDLTEIESSLMDSGLLSETAVVQHNGVLVAFYVVNNEASDVAAQLKAYGQKHLAHYAQPQQWLALDKLPTLISRKVDRQALLQLIPELDLSTTYVAPQTDAETLLCTLAAKALELPVEKVGRDDNFFALGGNSLTGVGFIAELTAQTGVDLPLHQLFNSADFAALGFELVKRQLLSMDEEQAFSQLLSGLPQSIAERVMDALENEMG